MSAMYNAPSRKERIGMPGPLLDQHGHSGLQGDLIDEEEDAVRGRGQSTSGKT